MTQAVIHDKRTAASLKAKKRARELYEDLTKARNGQAPFDREICSCLEKEGFRKYTPAMISKWRRADDWSGNHRPAPSRAAPILLTYTCGTELSFDEVKAVAADSMERHRKLASVFDKWINGLDPSALAVGEGLRIYEMLGKSVESIESLRVRLEDQRSAEAKDVSPPGVPIRETTPKIQSTIDRLRARLNANP